MRFRLLLLFSVLMPHSFCAIINEGIFFCEESNIINIHDKVRSTVGVMIGSTFTLNLPSNPTTGFRWYLKSLENLKVIKYVNPADTGIYFPSINSDNLEGAPGRQHFTFKALWPGKVVLTLWYMRIWLTEPAAIYEVVVNVQSSYDYSYSYSVE